MLGDVSSGLAACTLLKEASHSGITVEFKINFLEPMKCEYLIGCGKVIKETKSLIFSEASIKN